MKPMLLCCMLLAMFWAGCTQSGVATPQPVLIRIAGSNSMRPVLLALTEEFSRRNPNVVFDVRGGGSTLGQADVASAKIDLAASILAPPSAATLTPTNEPDLVRTPIGIDGLAIVVHEANGVEGLTLTQLRDIFDGRTLNWQEVGGEDGEILLVSREDGSGARVLFEERVMAAEQVSLTAIVMPTSADVIDFVSKNPLAIGYVSRAFVAPLFVQPQSNEQGIARMTEQLLGDRGQPQLPIRVLTLDGELPYVEQLTSQRYQLVYPLFLVSRDVPAGWIARFIDFTLSPGGQELVGHFSAPVR